MNNYSKANSNKEHLERLQENSWQLELLVSGFVIFGLFQAIEPIQKMARRAAYEENQFTIALTGVLFASIFILIFNLILHLIFRGLWIGALGLRSVSGDVAFENLNYSEKFTRFLQKKIGSFDNYIDRLEKISSVIFAISFLLIFYVLSVFVIFQLLNVIFMRLPLENQFVKGVARVFTFIYVIGALLTLIDFITLGLLKKNKWVAKVYFPIYRVFSVLTLSFLYRPLTYNLLDNKFGRRVSLLLVPVFIGIIFLSSISNERSNYLREFYVNKSTNAIADGYNYADYVKEKEIYPKIFTIQSKVITEPYLNVKIPLKAEIEDNVFEFNETLKPQKDRRGYRTSVTVRINEGVDEAKKVENAIEKYLDTFENIYHVKIDSTIHQTEFIVYNEQVYGFETYLPTKGLTEGKHVLTLMKRKHPKTDSLEVLQKVPFWYYNEKK